MKRLAIFLGICCIAAAGCSGPPSESAASAADSGKAPTAATFEKGYARAGSMRLASSPPPERPRAVVRKASLSMRVDDVKAAERQIATFARESHGFVEQTSATDLDTVPKTSMVVRVPESVFDRAMDKFESLGVRISKSVSGEDVTVKIVDSTARLKNMDAEANAYRTMLQQARSVKDTIEINDKLMQIQGDIEVQAAELKELSGLAALSTIQIDLQQSVQTTAAAATKNDSGWAKEEFAAATSAFTATFKSAAVLLIWAVIFCPFWLPGVLLVRHWLRSSKLHGKVSKAPNY